MKRVVQGVYKLGDRELDVSMKLHYVNRQNLITALKKTSNLKNSSVTRQLKPNSFILIAGASESPIGSCDVSYQFRQESYFHWMFGVLEPDFLGGIDVDLGHSYLFMPRLDVNYATFMGELLTPKAIKEIYQVDLVYFIDQIADIIGQKAPTELLLLSGKNTDSGLTTNEAFFCGIEKFNINRDLLYPEITECRVIKTELELEVLRYSNHVSSLAHKKIMQIVRPGMFEYQVESLFKHFCYYFGGMRHVSYTCIGASGHNCSVLHYGHAGTPNERKICDGDMCLFDMGAEYYCYTSDITCSYPVNGRFTPDQALVYNAVLAANKAVFKELKPGVLWSEMHLLAERVLLLHLRDNLKIVTGDIEEMMKSRLGAAFMPHGLGHLMGLDVHDVGGYSTNHDVPQRPSADGICKLRFARPLLAGMVLTVEPGCYFIDFLIDDAMKDPIRSKFLVKDNLSRFRHFGGVRIEDNVAITKDGAELLTNVPRTVEDIEAHMSKKISKLDFSLENLKDFELL